MVFYTRRAILAGMAVVIAAPRVRAAPAEHQPFIAAAFKMKDEAVQAGDQPYGRVVLKRDWTAHAEREAMREAQARLGTKDLSGCLLYSTSRPCSACEAAAAEAKIARMLHGAAATDAGAPRRH